MKKAKAFLALVVAVAFAASAFAGSVPAPSLPNGQRANSPEYSGFSHKLINSTTETSICSGVCTIAGVIMDTGALDSFVTLRDTNAADGNGTVVVRILFDTNSASPTPGKFAPLKIRSLNGWTSEISAAANDEAAVFLYTDHD